MPGAAFSQIILMDFRILRSGFFSVILLVSASIPADIGYAFGEEPLLAPTLLEIDPTTTDTATLRIFNNESFPVDWQAAAFAWRVNVNGVDELMPTNRISPEPAKTHLQPHTGAILRFKYSTESKFREEESYRIILTSSPVGYDRVAATYTHSLPLIVTSKEMRSQVDAELSDDGAGRTAIILRNTGTKYAYAARVLVAGFDADGNRVFETERPGWYVLPGGEISYPFDINIADCMASASLKASVELREGSRIDHRLPRSSCRNESEDPTGFLQPQASDVRAHSSAPLK